jgi:hypothetical protein
MVRLSFLFRLTLGEYGMLRKWRKGHLATDACSALGGTQMGSVPERRVPEMGEGKGFAAKSGGSAAADQWTHRQALHLIALLPDDQQQAIAILERARFLLSCWTLKPESQAKAQVVSWPKRAAGG